MKGPRCGSHGRQRLLVPTISLKSPGNGPGVSDPVGRSQNVLACPRSRAQVDTLSLSACHVPSLVTFWALGVELKEAGLAEAVGSLVKRSAARSRPGREAVWSTSSSVQLVGDVLGQPCYQRMLVGQLLPIRSSRSNFIVRNWPLKILMAFSMTPLDCES